MLKVAVNGAAGRMGQELVRTLIKTQDVSLVAASDINNIGQDVGTVAGICRLNLEMSTLEDALKKKPDVVVDFTNPTVVMGNIYKTFSAKTDMVIGTTGLVESDVKEIERLCEKYNTRAIIAPNFAIGAVLMMKFASIAAKFLQDVEIIEMHHEQKMDSPSGTAIKTAEIIANTKKNNLLGERKDFEKISGARGGEINGVRIHSVRLPGLVAHQEVIFGGIGQTLTVRHDSLNREAFMPGVLLAIRKIKEVDRVIYGLENLIDF
jgi:4-hydroxy-tetrahydrodipicolinate reductase